MVYRARIHESGQLVVARLRTAHTHWTRLRGLIGTSTLPAGEGLWIRPCRQVHMFWMRYPIDVVFLDEHHRVLDIVTRLPPWRVSPKVPNATSVIEVAAGAAGAVSVGDQLDIEPA